MGIDLISENVVSASKYGNWNIDFFNRNQVSLVFGIDQMTIAIRPNLEPILVHVLRVVLYGFC